MLPHGPAVLRLAWLYSGERARAGARAGAGARERARARARERARARARARARDGDMVDSPARLVSAHRGDRAEINNR